MTRRARSILIDATLGKIFVNTSATTPTDPSKLIAGSRLTSSTLSASAKTKVSVANNLGFKGVGIPFVTGGLLAAVTLSVAAAPIGSPIIVNVKIGSTYATSTVQATVSLYSGTMGNGITTSTFIPAGHNIYLDVAQTGSIKPGFGLSIRLDYYKG